MLDSAFFPALVTRLRLQRNLSSPPFPHGTSPHTPCPSPGHSEPALSQSASVGRYWLPPGLSDPLEARVGWARQKSNAWIQRKGQSRGDRPSAGSLGVSRAQGRAGELQRRGTALAPCHRERVSPPPYARRRVHPCQFQLSCRGSLRLWATLSHLSPGVKDRAPLRTTEKGKSVEAMAIQIPIPFQRGRPMPKQSGI